MTTARYWTAQQVIDQAALECGLAAPGSGVYGSTDANVVLLRNLLNLAGQDLALSWQWPALVKEHTITVVNPGDTGTYTLPADFNGLINQTGWDRSSDTDLGGPLSPQTWQYRIASSTTPIWVEFRLQQDTLKTLPAPPANGTVISFEYMSRYWVKAAASGSPDKATATVSTDVVFFEPGLIVALLRLRFLEARGLDTTAALVTYERRYEMARSATAAAPVLNVAGGQRWKWIDESNAPETGYGA